MLYYIMFSWFCANLCVMVSKNGLVWDIREGFPGNPEAVPEAG